MSNKFQFSSNRLSRMGIITMVCGLALIASACGGGVVNSTDATPDIVKEAASPTEPLMEVPAETAAVLPQTSGADQDACSLITTADAEAVMGQPIVSVNPFSYLDNDYGQTVSSCYYMGENLTVIVSTVDFGTVQTANKMLQEQYDKELADNEGVIINEEPGLGDKAYWTITENGGSYAILDGSKFLVVGIGGNIGDASSYKASLLTFAKTILSKN